MYLQTNALRSGDVTLFIPDAYRTLTTNHPIAAMHHVLLTCILGITVLAATSLHGGDETAAGSRPAIGQTAGLTLLTDEFDGVGSVTKGLPQEDIDGSGWQTPMADGQPRREGGRLVSGGEGGVAAIMLPPLSRHGEITITASLFLRGGGSLIMGFTDAVRNPRDGAGGPLLRIGGDGRLVLFQDATTAAKEAQIPRPATPDRPVTLTILHRIWERTLVVSANGRTIATATFAKAPNDTYRCLALAFDAADPKAGPAVDALRVEYVPVPRPQPMVANQTVVVRDTTLAGITKAIQDANARSAPDNIIAVSIPKGDYHFKVPNGFSGGQLFLVLGLKNLIIDWNDSNIIIDDPWYGLFSLSHGNRVTVRNIASIDYPQDNLPFTQGTIRAFNEAARTFDLEIDAGYPLPNNTFFMRKSMNWGQLMDPARPGMQVPGSALHYDITSIQQLQGRLFRYALNLPLYAIQVGSRFAHCPRTGNEVFRIFEAEDVRLENVTGHSCANFWSMIYHARVSYDNVRVLLKPGRLMTVNGDIASGEQNRLWIEDCLFEGNADDICHQFRGEGTFVADSIFRRSRRFGVWFNTGEHGVVKGCLFDGVGKYAITGMKEPGMREDIRLSSRNILCFGNTIRNGEDDDAVFIEAMHTRPDPAPHWNTYWRLIGNSATAPITIRSASNVKCINNIDPGGRPAVINVDQGRTRDVVVRTGRPAAMPVTPEERPIAQAAPKPAAPAKAATPEPVPVRITVLPAGLAAFDARLLARVGEQIAAGRPPMFAIAAIRSKASIERAGTDGGLVLMVNGSELTWEWKRLDLRDKADLAVAMAKAFHPGDAAESAFWLLASGQRDAGERQLAMADGAGSAAVKAAITIEAQTAAP